MTETHYADGPEDFTLFYDGPFSQWHSSPFESAGIQYNCAEQYMMAQKAMLFNDTVRFAQIMSTDDPHKQKMLGRAVAGFDRYIWQKMSRSAAERAVVGLMPYCCSVVLRGNLAKFQQNEDLYVDLRSTGGTTLVEASPDDQVWGIGLSEGHPDCLSRERWRGTNWLGEVLTRVRTMLEIRSANQS